MKGDVWVLGDLSFPDISWSEEHVPSVEPGCSFPKLYEDFNNTLEDCNLVQMVSQPTRGENTLDLFLTSNYTLVNNVDVKPGISDHDLVFSEVFTNQLKLGNHPGLHTCIEKQTGEALTLTWKRSNRKFWQAQLLSRWKNFGFCLNHPSMKAFLNLLPAKRLVQRGAFPGSHRK